MVARLNSKERQSLGARIKRAVLKEESDKSSDEDRRHDSENESQEESEDRPQDELDYELGEEENNRYDHEEILRYGKEELSAEVLDAQELALLESIERSLADPPRIQTPRKKTPMRRQTTPILRPKTEQNPPLTSQKDSESRRAPKTTIGKEMKEQGLHGAVAATRSVAGKSHQARLKARKPAPEKGDLKLRSGSSAKIRRMEIFNSKARTANRTPGACRT